MSRLEQDSLSALEQDSLVSTRAGFSCRGAVIAAGACTRRDLKCCGCRRHWRARQEPCCRADTMLACVCVCVRARVRVLQPPRACTVRISSAKPWCLPWVSALPMRACCAVQVLHGRVCCLCGKPNVRFATSGWHMGREIGTTVRVPCARKNLARCGDE